MDDSHWQDIAVATRYMKQVAESLMLVTAGSTRQVPTQRLRMCCLTKLAYQGSLAYCAGNATQPRVRLYRQNRRGHALVDLRAVAVRAIATQTALDEVGLEDWRMGRQYRTASSGHAAAAPHLQPDSST